MNLSTPELRQKFYQSKRWRQLREYHLRSEPLCQECFKNDIIEAGHTVHHLIPIEQSPQLCLDPKNLETLCLSCHSKRTASEMGWSKEPVGRLLNNTWKIDVTKFKR